MQIEYLLRGVAIGFSVAAPVGPIGILCIHRTLSDGWSTGMLSGLGAACADMVYGGIAAFGIRAVSEFLLNQQVWIRTVGGLFLIYLGIRTIISVPSEREMPSSQRGLLGVFLSTFLLTLTNPMTILSFGAMFAGFGLLNEGVSYSVSGLIVLGVFLGSGLWWFLLSGGVNLLRTRFSVSLLKWVNRLSGGVITTFGVIIILSALKF
jgi:threonine/homoserine/homoserine lactone efflux protein